MRHRFPRLLALAGLPVVLLFLGEGRSGSTVPTGSAVPGVSTVPVDSTGPTHPLPDFPSATAQESGLSPEGLQAATALLEAHIEAGDIPGVVAAVVRDGHLVYHEALGYRDKDSGAPMTPDALFRIYSMTRPVTSLGVLLLEAEGRLEVDDPVKRFLPAFGHLPVLVDPTRPDPEAVRSRTGEVTLAQLLTHTSGIGSRSSALYRTHAVHRWDRTLEEVVDRLTMLPLFEDPGTRYRYGMHAEVLGRVLEVATGMPYEEFVARRILDPLGMKDTGFTVPPERAGRLVPVHRADGEGRLRPHAMEEIPVTGDRTLRSAGVGLVSTAADMLRFSRPLLEEGWVGDDRLMGPDGVRMMMENAVPDALLPLGDRGYWAGSGWSLGGMAVALDPGAYAHRISRGTAWWDGSVGTRFWVDPVEKMIIVIMSQVSPASGGGFREAFKSAIMEAIEEPRARRTDEPQTSNGGEDVPDTHGPPRDPEEAAGSYLAAVERMDWRGMVALIHPEALTSFRRYVEIVMFRGWDPRDDAGAEPPPEVMWEPAVLEALTGASSLDAYRSLDDATILMRALDALARDSPGMMNAWVARRTEVLGAVLEEDDLAHVVYRLEWTLSGATPDVELLGLKRMDDGRWAVTESRELASIRPALSGVTRRVEGPDRPGGDP